MIIVFDIDGTLANIGPRYEKAGPMPARTNKKVFKAWLDRLQNPEDMLKDKPIAGMRPLATTLALMYTAVYITGRGERYREVTTKWLSKEGFPSCELYMRSHEDWRPSGLYKEAKMLDVVSRYGDNDLIVFDDDYDEKCGEVYKKHGWTWLRAMENIK